MKRLFCLFVLSSFCFLNSTNFAYADNNTCSRLTVDQLPDGPGGSGEVRKGYERRTFTIYVRTGWNTSMGWGYQGGQAGAGQTCVPYNLSCCVKVSLLEFWKRDSTCDFGIDSAECRMYIDSETGKEYPHKNIYW